MKDDKKDKKKKEQDVVIDISCRVPVSGLPDTPQELINTYGTYEIQDTADTKNQYPAIAQGFNNEIIERDCENSHHGGKWETDR